MCGGFGRSITFRKDKFITQTSNYPKNKGTALLALKVVQYSQPFTKPQAGHPRDRRHIEDSVLFSCAGEVAALSSIYSQVSLVNSVIASCWTIIESFISFYSQGPLLIMA